MNLNKALVISFCLLFLLVVVTIFNLNRSKNSQNGGYEFAYNGLLMNNVHCIPEIIRSYNKVKNVDNRKNILLFRYVKTTCSTCNEIFLNEILDFQEKIGKDNVLIFSAYPDDRGSRIQLSNELAKFNYRNISTDSLVIPVYRGEPKSYFAWINDEGEIEMVFVPDRNNVQYTRQYFLEIKRMLQMVEKN